VNAVTIPLPELLAIMVGAALIVAATVALFTRSWYDAALHRRTWLDHTVKPNVRWWTHNLIAHPLLVFCPRLGERLHDATIPEGDR